MQKTLDITFIRTGENTYSTTAVRGDKVTMLVPSYDRKAWLPHDLTHYLVERELGLTHGFWGAVAEGALFPNMVVLAGRQKPNATARSQAIIRALGEQGTEAEVLVYIMLHIASDGLHNNWPAAQKIVRQTWQPLHAAHAPLTFDEVRQVGTALHTAKAQWQNLAYGDSLTVHWSHPSWFEPTESKSRARQLVARRRGRVRV